MSPDDDYLNGFERSSVERGYAELAQPFLKTESSPRVWDQRFDQLIRLVALDGAIGWAPGNPRETVSDSAISSLVQALGEEAAERYKDRPPSARALERRLGPIVGAIASRERTRTGAVAVIGAKLRFVGPNPRHRRYILDWLTSLRHEGLAEAGIAVAEIWMGAWGDTWEDASPHLILLLGHVDDSVRANAACALGNLCDPYPPDSAPLEQTLNLIAAKEVERPGVAAAFWWGVEGHVWMLHSDGKSLPVEPKRWMMDLLRSRGGPEPSVAGFNSLESVAARLFEGDINFIRESLASGLDEVALGAAWDTDAPLPGLDEILLQLSETNELFVVWQVSFALARIYGQSCPRGEELGLVRHFVDPRGADILMLTDEGATAGNPRIAVLRPIEPDGLWDDSTAWRWIDLLVPPALRGELESPSEGIETVSDDGWYRFASDVHVALHGDVIAHQWRWLEVVANGTYGTWDMQSLLQGAS